MTKKKSANNRPFTLPDMKHALLPSNTNDALQAKLTAQEAAQLWSKVRLLAEEYGMDLVSPAVNYCYGDCIEEVSTQYTIHFSMIHIFRERFGRRSRSRLLSFMASKLLKLALKT